MKKLVVFFTVCTISFSCFAQSNVIDCVSDSTKPTIYLNAKGEDGKWIKDGSWAYKSAFNDVFKSSQVFTNNEVKSVALKVCNELRNEWTVKNDCLDSQNSKYTCAYNTKTKKQETYNGSSVGGNYIWSLNNIAKKMFEAMIDAAYVYQRDKNPGALAICGKPRSDSDFFMVKVLQKKDALWKIETGQFYAYQSGDYSTMMDLQIFIDSPVNTPAAIDKKKAELIKIKSAATKRVDQVVKQCNVEAKNWIIKSKNNGINPNLTVNESFLVYYQDATQPDEYATYQEAVNHVMTSLKEKIESLISEVLKDKNYI